MTGGIDMDERDWLIISTLYRHKNITKTANLLYLSQPALTARIKHIENILGVLLIQRSNKGVSFTPYGEYTAKFAIKYLKELADFKDSLKVFGNELSGVLKIAVPSIIGRYYLPFMLESFQSIYPKIRFEITTATSSEVIKLVKSNLVDFGFTKHADEFAPENKLLLMSYNALIACSRPFEITNLPEMDMIIYPYEESYYNQIKKWWEETFSNPPSIGNRVSNLDIAKEMIFAGLGYGILPEILVPECTGPLYTKAMHFKDGSVFNRDTWLIFNKEDIDALPIQKALHQFITDSYFPGFLRQRNQKEPAIF